MVFAQIYCVAADFVNGQPKLYQLNVSGNKKIVLLGLSYKQNAGASSKNIGLQSNSLQVRQGQHNFLIFSTDQSNFNIAGGNHKIVFDNVNLNGNIDINFIDHATNIFPGGFNSAIIYLDIVDIPQLELK
jgi:hypothetical protein